MVSSCSRHFLFGFIILVGYMFVCVRERKRVFGNDRQYLYNSVIMFRLHYKTNYCVFLIIIINNSNEFIYTYKYMLFSFFSLLLQPSISFASQIFVFFCSTKSFIDLYSMRDSHYKRFFINR